MTHARRWAIAAATLVGLLAAAWLALWAWVPSDEELARRLETAFEDNLGEPLEVGSVHWRLLGLPVVEVLDARTVQEEGVIRVRRIAAYPALLPLLRKELVVNRLEVDGAELPRNALLAFRGQVATGEGTLTLHRLAFTNLTYTSYSGIPVVYEGEMDFDGADRLPSRLLIRRPGVEPPVSLEAVRDGQAAQGADGYRLHLEAGGGSAQGQARLATSDEGHMVLTGELAPRGIEVQSLLEAFHRRAFIGGRASGRTELNAEGRSPAELLRSLHTRSVLEVQSARLLRIDVEKTVTSLGEDRAGQTRLDRLSGVMDTQNTEQGMKTEFTRLEAAAGSYSATGRATLYRQRVDAEGQLDIAGGVVGVPFSLHGPTKQPEFEIAKGAIAGAAIGTPILPGVGTVLGAKIGGAVTGPPKPDDKREERPRSR